MISLPIILAQAAAPASTPPEIRDIAAPVYVFPYPMWMVYTAAGVVFLILVLLVWLIIRWWRNRPAPVPPTPREMAIADLEKARTQIHVLDPHAFSILVSDILRRYVSQQYSLQATRQTSPEFLASISNFTGFSDLEKQLLERFLEKCDLIKFARIDASEQESAALLDQAVQFVKGGVA